MASAAENTKIELVVEAFENLALATAVSLQASGRHANDIGHVMVGLTDARKQMAESLREFLKPTLRIVAPPVA